MNRILQYTALILTLLPAVASARGDDKSDYHVISPKYGWTGSKAWEERTWGVSYSRYPNYNLGYGIAINQMFGGPEIDITGKAIFMSLGLSAGPMVSRRGLGLTMGAFTSLVYIGVEARANWVDDKVQGSGTVFIPFWWRNGKFWDIDGAIGRLSMSGYH
ncbi:MAG: hypothetical protein IPK50_08110 [Fibrobacterota bacterium]|nr:hypothetical protein [Fibrobacterota bacterium]QQS06850.1 MAG: hypothetical protein IPK50_08110 [Fibrobacterota bacterium]